MLALDDETLAAVIEERRRLVDYSSARTFGAMLRRARQQTGLTLHEISIESGVSARLLWLVEEGALHTDQVPAVVVDAAAGVLEVDIDDLRRRATSVDELPPSGLGEMVAEIPGSRDGLWIHTTRLPLRLVSGGDVVIVGPSPELAYSRVVIVGAGDDSLAQAVVSYLPNSGQLSLRLPKADGAFLIYLD